MATAFNGNNWIWLIIGAVASFVYVGIYPTVIFILLAIVLSNIQGSARQQEELANTLSICTRNEEVIGAESDTITAKIETLATEIHDLETFLNGEQSHNLELQEEIHVLRRSLEFKKMEKTILQQQRSFLDNLLNRLTKELPSKYSGRRIKDRVFSRKKTETETYSVKIAKDSEMAHIISICELTEGELVLADKENKRVKLMNDKYVITAFHDIVGLPKDMCRSGNSDVSILLETDAETKEVLVLKVCNGNFLKDRNFVVKSDCLSISYNLGVYFICSKNVIYRYNSEGLELNAVSDLVQSSQGTIYNIAVSPNGVTLYVTSCEHNLFTIDMNGLRVNVLKCPVEPRKVCVSDCGHVFVGGYGNRQVVQVSKGGDQILASFACEDSKTVKVRSLWFVDRTSTLLVACDYMQAISLK